MAPAEYSLPGVCPLAGSRGRARLDDRGCALGPGWARLDDQQAAHSLNGPDPPDFSDQYEDLRGTTWARVPGPGMLQVRRRERAFARSRP
jgi:hypothetical protein